MDSMKQIRDNPSLTYYVIEPYLMRGDRENLLVIVDKWWDVALELVKEINVEDPILSVVGGAKDLGDLGWSINGNYSRGDNSSS